MELVNKLDWDDGQELIIIVDLYPSADDSNLVEVIKIGTEGAYVGCKSTEIMSRGQAEHHVKGVIEKSKQD